MERREKQPLLIDSASRRLIAGDDFLFAARIKYLRVPSLFSASCASFGEARLIGDRVTREKMDRNAISPSHRSSHASSLRK
jgi:hypothetical protein